MIDNQWNAFKMAGFLSSYPYYSIQTLSTTIIRHFVIQTVEHAETGSTVGVLFPWMGCENYAKILKSIFTKPNV